MTEITNEQLEAWASLGPWFAEAEADDGPEDEYVWSVFHVDPYVNDGDRLIAEFNLLGGEEAKAFAAFPQLAAALLAERKAREVEVGRLKRTMFTVRVIAVDAQLRATYQRTALERISAELRAALEGPTHE